MADLSSFRISARALVRWMLVALVLGLTPPAARAEMGQTLAALAQAELAFVKLAGTDPGALSGAREISTDILFLLEEVERLGETASQEVNLACGAVGTPLTLRHLSGEQCLRAALVAERAVWRLGAEVAAQLYLSARGELAIRLPMPGLDTMEEDHRKVALEWWNRSAPSALDAFARIGREWIKRVRSEAAEETRALAIAALDRTLREPSVVHLRQALSAATDPVLQRLNAEFLVMSATDGEEADRLEAAARFAGALDDAISGAVSELLADAPSDVCAMLADALVEVDANATQHCGLALAVVRQAVTEDQAANEAVQAVMLALSERTLTIRLLLAKAAAASGATDCPAAINAMATVAEPLSIALDLGELEAGGKGLARVLETCLPAAAATLVGELCSAGTDLASATAISVVSRLPQGMWAKLEAPWRQVLATATEEQSIGELCDDPVGALAGLRERSAAQQSAFDQALTAFGTAALDSVIALTLESARPFLDQIRFPARMVGDALSGVEALCTLAAGAGERDELSGQWFAATLRELGLINAEGEREQGFADACTVVEQTRGQVTSDQLTDVVMAGLKSAASGEELAAEALTARVDAVVSFVKGLAARFGDRGPTIARRAATAMILAKAGTMLSGNLSLYPGGSTCGDDPAGVMGKFGLSLGLQVADVDASLDVTGDAWTVKFAIPYAISACGPVEKGPTSAQSIKTLVEASGTAAPAFNLDEASDPTAVVAVLTEAVRASFRDAELDTSELTTAVAGKIAGILRAAGLEPAVVLALTKGSPDFGVEWDAEAGLLLRPVLPAGGGEATNLCIQLRLRSEGGLVDGCIDARNLDALPALLSGHFVRAFMPSIVDLAGAIGITVTPEHQGMLSASLQGEYLGAVYRDGKTTMVLRIPVAPINAWLKQLGAEGDVEPFIGDLVVPFEFGEGGQLVAGQPTMPDFNPAFLLDQFKFATENNFIQLTEVSGLPLDDGRAGDRLACEQAVVYRADLGPAAPLQGLLGHMCLKPAGDGKLRFVAAKSGELVTRDMSWRFSFRRTEENGDIKQGWIGLALSVQTNDPQFAEVNGLSALVQFDLRSGEWRLPNEEPENQAFYAAIESSANGLLPAGVRILGVGFGSNGLEVKFDADEEAATVAFADLTVGTVDWASVRAGIDTACGLAKLYELARMVESGRVQQAVTGVPCPVESALDGESEVLVGAPIFWECSVASGDLLDNCRISFDKDATLCERPLTIDVSWDEQNRDRSIESAELKRCFSDRLAKVLPDDLRGAVQFEEIDLVGECLTAPESCGLSLAANVDLGALFQADEGIDPAAIASRLLGEEAGSVCGELTDDLAFKVTAEMTFNGATRFGLPGAGEGLVQRMDACAQAVRRAAIKGAMDAVDVDGRVDELLAGIAERGVSFLEETTKQIDSRLGSTSTCKLVMGSVVGESCEALDADALRDGDLRGVEITTNLDMLDAPFRLATRFTFDPSDLDATKLLDGSAPDQIWQDLRRRADESFSLNCSGEGGQACLDAVSRSLLEKFEGRFVKIAGQATLSQSDGAFTVSVPLMLDFGLGGIKPTVLVGCTVSVEAWDQIGTTCDTDVSHVLLATLETELKKLGPKEFDLDLFKLRINTPSYSPQLKEIGIPVTLSLAGLDIGADSEVEGTIIIDHRGSVSFDTNIFADFVDRLEGALTAAVNDLVGDVLPVKVTGIDILDSDSNGIPTRIGIESEATLYGVMSVSAPMLVLGQHGIKLDGPGRYSITIVDGFQIPIPPVALCPTGGAIEDSKLTLNANITIGECTASHILSLRGSVTIDFDNIDLVSAQGDLVVLSVIPLGHTEGSVEIDPLSMTYKAELGGAISDIISMKTDFNMTGNPMIIDASGDGQIFRTPVATMKFHLDLDQGLLDTNVMVDLLFATGDGYLRTERGLSRPTAELNAQMDIGGLPVFGSQIKARPSFAKVALSIFGLRLAIAFPGLDAISSDAIKDLIENLLTPDFENLDEALMALLKGNLTINPFAGFGSGGDGMGDSGDGDSGESAEGNDAGDPGEGLGGDMPATAAGPDQADPGPVPAGGEPGGGLLGTQAAELWFQLMPDTTLLRIGTGVRGTDQERVLALAERDAAHFDGDGVRRGETLSILQNGYSQILAGQHSPGEPCAAVPADAAIAVFYTGTEAPRRGYYELCRLLGADGQAMTPERLRTLSEEERRDLAVFHEALLEELRARPELPSHDQGRLLLKARMVVSGAMDGLRGVIGFQRPGEALVAVSGRVAGGQCHETPSGEAPAAPETRLFWLMGLTAEQLDKPDKLFEIVRHLWNCETGTMARVDVERETVTTPSAISAKSETGYQQVAQLPDVPQPAGGGGPLWASDVTDAADGRLQQVEIDEQEKARDEKLRETLAAATGAPSVGADLPSLCAGDPCSAITVVFSQTPEGQCVLDVNSKRISTFDHGPRFDEACSPFAGLTWLTSSGDKISVAVGLAPAGAPLSIGVFTETAFGETPPLNLGITGDTITNADVHLLNGYLDTVFTPDGLAGTKSLLADQATGAALTGPVGDGTQHWTVRRESTVFSFTQKGEAIPDDKRQGVLPLITDKPEWFELLDVDNLILAAGKEGRVYRWMDGAWALTSRLYWPDLSIAGDMPLLRQTALDAAARSDASAVADVVVIPHDPSLGGWGTAEAFEGGTDGSIAMRLVQSSDIVPNQDALSLLVEGDAPLVVAGGTITEDWFALDVPADPAGLQVQVVRNTSSFDPVLCVYASDGTLLAGDDDNGPADLDAVDTTGGSAGTNARIILPDGLAGTTVYARVTKYQASEGTTGGGYSLIVSRVVEGESHEMNPNQCVGTIAAALDFGVPPNPPVSIAGLAALVVWLGDDRTDDDTAAATMLRVLGARILKDTLPAGTAIVTGRSDTAVALPHDDVIELLKPVATGLDLTPIATIGGAPPPHALAGIVDHLAGWPAPTDLTGALLSLDGTDISQAWAVDLPDAAGGAAERAIYYLYKEQPQRLLVPGAAADGPILAEVLAYATANKAAEVEILRTTDPSAIALATFDSCSTGTCARKLVYLTPGQSERVVAVETAEASEAQFKTLVDAFEEAVTANAELSDATVFQGDWPGTPEGIGAFRLTKTGPLHLVRHSGEWLCLNVETPSVTDRQLHTLLQSWPANFEHWRSAVGSCSAEGVPTWTLELAPSFAEAEGSPGAMRGLLHGSHADGRLTIATVGLGTKSVSATTERPVPDVLAKDLVAHFKSMLAKATEEAFADFRVIYQGSDDGLLIYNAASSSDATNELSEWTIGLLAHPEDPKATACVIPRLSVSWPADADRAVVEEVVKQLGRMVDQSTCGLLNTKRLVVVRNGEGWDVFATEEVAQAGVPPPDRIRVASDDPIVIAEAIVGLQSQTPGYVVMEKLELQGGLIRVPRQALSGLSRLASEDRLQMILGAIVAISDELGGMAPDLQLDCADSECSRLWGKWGADATVGVELLSEGEGEKARVAATQPGGAVAASADIAWSLLDLATGQPGWVAGTFEVAARDGAMIAVDVRGLNVSVRPSRDAAWGEIGAFPGTWWPSSSSRAATKLRAAALQYLLDHPDSFEAVTLDKAWAALPAPLGDKPAPALLAFHPGDLRELVVIRPTGETGPIYYDTDLDPPTGAIALHAAASTDLTEIIWLPTEDLAATLAGLPKEGWVSVLRVARIAGEARPESLLSFGELGCSGAPQVIGHIISRALAERPDKVTTQLQCDETDAVVRLALDTRKDRAYAADASHGFAIALDRTAAVRPGLLLGLAKALLADESSPAPLSAQAFMSEGLALAASDQGTVLSVANDSGQAVFLGRFAGLSDSTKLHKLLSRMLARKLSDLTGRVVELDQGQALLVDETRLFIQREAGLLDIEVLQGQVDLTPGIRALIARMLTLDLQEQLAAVFTTDSAVLFDRLPDGSFGQRVHLGIPDQDGSALREIGALAKSLQAQQAIHLASTVLELVGEDRPPATLIQLASGRDYASCLATGGELNLDLWADGDTKREAVSADLPSCSDLEQLPEWLIAARTDLPDGESLVFTEDGAWLLHSFVKPDATATGTLHRLDGEGIHELCADMPRLTIRRGSVVKWLLARGECTLVASHAIDDNGQIDGLLVGWGGEAVFFSPEAEDRLIAIDDDAVTISTQRARQLAAWLALKSACNEPIRVHALPEREAYQAIQGTCAGIVLWNESSDSFRKIIAFSADQAVTVDEFLIWSVVEHYGADLNAQPAVGWVGEQGQVLAIRAGNNVAFALKGGELLARLDLEGGIDQALFALLSERLSVPEESGFVLARAAMLPPDENGRQAIVLATKYDEVLPPWKGSVGNPEDDSWTTVRNVLGTDGWVSIQISDVWDKVITPAVKTETQEAFALRSWLNWQSPNKQGAELWFEGERVRFVLGLEGEFGFRLLADGPPCRIAVNTANLVMKQFLAPDAAAPSLLELVTRAPNLALPLWYRPSLMADPRLTLESQADCLAWVAH